MDKSHCIGCNDDFYNDKNPYGIKECWLLKKAELITRYRLHRDTPMNQKRGYQKMQKPQCYTQKGYVFLKQIPDHAE